MDLEVQYEKLLRYCYMKVKDRYVAEDIVQETYLKFWQNHTYKDTGKELAYLYTIARNLCVEEFRRRKPESIDTITDVKADEKMNPENSLNRLVIESALEQLPEDVREMMMLRFTNEMAVTDIAKIVGISRFAVHRRIKEGLSILREKMEGAGNDD
ncbi:MAG: sigma-70 family RNA polymerase sigma factor [bacterium]|nr:sigma-70 family RNA polymerase sigma factor [bacterium]